MMAHYYNFTLFNWPETKVEYPKKVFRLMYISYIIFVHYIIEGYKLIKPQ